MATAPAPYAFRLGADSPYRRLPVVGPLLDLDLEAKRQALDESERVLSGRQRGLLRPPDHDLIEWLESQ